MMNHKAAWGELKSFIESLPLLDNAGVSQIAAKMIEIEQRDAKPKLRPAADHIVEFMAGAIGAVEANSYEKHTLWKENNEVSKRAWEPNLSGYGVCVGTFDSHEVWISLLYDMIDGHKILFWHVTSTYVDHDLVERWLVEYLPTTARRPGDNWPVKVDAMNFPNVFHYQRDRTA